MRKNVDTDARKNKKVRYDVLEKLVGFVTPVGIAELEARDDIVGNLFGGLLRSAGLGKREFEGGEEDNQYDVRKMIKGEGVFEENDVELF